jgi:hypothetical protein
MELTGVPGFATHCVANFKEWGSGKPGQFPRRCVGNAWVFGFSTQRVDFFRPLFLSTDWLHSVWPILPVVGKPEVPDFERVAFGILSSDNSASVQDSVRAGQLVFSNFGVFFLAFNANADR